ncbi:MAG TPA: hypothetical protein VKM54_11855 [Myxococcota bacterium]|nr:hypothetical protein [Myxococcota bacterium]
MREASRRSGTSSGIPGILGIARLPPLDIERGQNRPREVATGPDVSQSTLGERPGPRGVEVRGGDRLGRFREVVGGCITTLTRGKELPSLTRHTDRLLVPKAPREGEPSPRKEARPAHVTLGQEIEGHAQEACRLFVRSCLLGGVCGRDTVRYSTLRARERCASVPLRRDLTGVLAGVGVDTLHLLGEAPMESHLACGRELAVERVTDESVGEIVDLGIACGPQKLCLERLVESIERRVLLEPRRSRRVMPPKPGRRARKTSSPIGSL